MSTPRRKKELADERAAALYAQVEATRACAENLHLDCDSPHCDCSCHPLLTPAERYALRKLLGERA